MTERLCRKFWGRLKIKGSEKDEKLNPRNLYENNLFQEISRIENLSVPEPTLHEHLIDNRSKHHYGARCLAILSVGKQTRKGDITIIEMPETWQHLIGGEQVGLSEIGINALEKAMHKFEEAYPVEKL